MQSRPTIILSDTHFGTQHPGSARVADLAPMIEQAGHVIINGDVAELQHPKYQVRAARDILELQATCERLNTQLTLLSGNHDAYLEDQRHLTMRNGEILITHGDVLHPAVVPWSDASAWFKQQGLQALEQIPLDQRNTLESRLQIARHIGHSEFLDALDHKQNKKQTKLVKSLATHPRLLAFVIWYWLRAPHYAVQLIKHCAPGTRFFIFGHSHRQGVWHKNGRIIINTGSFHFPGSPRAVVIEDESLSVHRVVRRPSGLFNLQQPALRWYTLNPLPTQQKPDSNEQNQTHPINTRLIEQLAEQPQHAKESAQDQSSKNTGQNQAA